MADSIHAVGGSLAQDSYVEKHTFGIGFTDTFYVGFQMYVPVATLLAWAAITRFSPTFLNLFKSTGGGVTFEYFYDSNLDGVYDIYEDDFIGDTTGAVVGGVWVKFELQIDPTNGPGPETITLDGTVIATSFFGPGSSAHPTDKAWFGAVHQSGLIPDGDVYFGEIRIGKSANAFDVFHFIPALASDLSAFDAVVGTVTLDSAPSAPPPWGGGPVAPVPVSAVAANLNVIITFDQTLDPASVPDPAQFDVKVNGASQTVDSVSLSGSDVTLVMAAPITRGAVVTVDYTYP